jgi:hypothetical protein
MLFRRVSENLKSQNWFAVWLDLVVVVLGIFLGFQADRWYETKRLESSLEERLGALAEDFKGNRRLVEIAIARQTMVESASRELLALDEGDLDQVEHSKFYKLLAGSSRSGSPPTIRRAYDALISTGEIELIASETLKSELASFYALFDELSAFSEGVWLYDRRTFEPYVMRELDHVAMLRHLHSASTEGMALTRPPEQFRQVLGTVDFQGVISGKWHISSDLLFRYNSFAERIDTIDELIADELGVMADDVFSAE